MANGTGNGVWKWVAIALWGVTVASGGFIVNSATDHIEANATAIDSVEEKADSAYLQLNRRMDNQELKAAKQILQLAEIAKALDAPVVVDTTAADSTVRDST